MLRPDMGKPLAALTIATCVLLSGCTEEIIDIA
jgi:hypothetical protein